MTALLLLALTGLLLATWSRQPGRAPARHPPAARDPRPRGTAVGPPTGPRTPGWRAVVGGRRRGRTAPDVGAVISEVATRLRSGAPVEHAWAAAVDRALGSPTRPDAGARSGLWPVGESDALPAGLRRLTQWCRGDAVAEEAVRAVTAATRLSRTTGAPLADVLDRCVETVVEAERAHDARSVALAGPRSTARLLTGLPLLGVLLGAGLGADPVATALDGSWGTVSVGSGVGLLYAGSRWSTSLVRAAQGRAAGRRGPGRPVQRGRPRRRARVVR